MMDTNCELIFFLEHKTEINRKRFPNKPLYFVPSVNKLRSCDTDHTDDVAAKLISIILVLQNHHNYLSTFITASL